MGHQLLRPFEVTWEDLAFGGGIHAQFPNPGLPLDVEIGPGDDDHLITCAQAHPERNWLGIEYSHKRVRRAVRRMEQRRQAPTNLRLVWRAAAEIVGPFLTPARVSTFHILFPDPWPKAHHARYRMLQAPFLADLAQALTPGGRIAIATDDPNYAVEIVEAAAKVRTLRNPAPDPGWREQPDQTRRTVFEARWREMGRRVHAIELLRV